MKRKLTTIRYVHNRLIAELPSGDKIENPDPEALARHLFLRGLQATDIRCLSWKHAQAPTAEQKSKLFCTLRALDLQSRPHGDHDH